LKIWTVQGNLMRVGRRPENDVVIHEQWVSQQHAEIICRVESGSNVVLFFLRDFSRFGTLMVNGRLEDQSTWQRVHHQEMPLESGTKLRFGSSQGQTLEFVVQRLDDNETYL
jgi:pSer/pThr/pTyr-binding forkhead associated (FHA) protein